MTRSHVRLSPLTVPKASEVLAHDLTERILGGEFPEETALPTERDLVEQTAMSRATVREALRILEARGLVRIRTGRAGGAFVRRPGEESLASTVGLVIRGQGLRLDAVHETREAVEPSCAELAARHRDDDDLARLDAANAAMDTARDHEDVLAANLDWHLAVAAASHNEILSGLMRALSEAIRAATDDESVIDDQVRVTTLAGHRSITDAVRRGNAAAARRGMARHVHGVAAALSGRADRRSAADHP